MRYIEGGSAKEIDRTLGASVRRNLLGVPDRVESVNVIRQSDRQGPRPDPNIFERRLTEK